MNLSSVLLKVAFFISQICTGAERSLTRVHCAVVFRCRTLYVVLRLPLDAWR